MKLLKVGSTYMIFAFNNEDPSCSTLDWKFHGDNRYTKSILLLNYRDDDIESQSQLPQETFKIEMRMRNVKLLA